MKLFLLFASVLFTLLALELVFANETEDELGEENYEEIYRDMKKRGLIDIDENDGLVRLISPTDDTAVPGQFICRLRPNPDYTEISRIVEGRGSFERLDFSEEDRYVILRGIAESDLQEFRRRPDLFEEIERDIRVSYAGHHSSAHSTGNLWNLERIYPRKKGDFVTCAPGTGIDAYVIDGGIYPYHPEFLDGEGKSRVKSGWHPKTYPYTYDDDGHGTHVASVLGGKTCGVAKEVNLISVKVFNNTYADLTDIEIAVTWVRNQVNPKRPGEGTMRLSVINMSVGIPRRKSLDNDVKAALNAGIPVVVAACNHNVSDPNDETDSCKASPANVPRALTVGATDKNDYLAAYSYFGSCVDIYAPGTAIWGANYTLDPMHGADSGTSFATPLVAGVVAGMLQVFRDAKYYTEPSEGVVKDINKYIIKYAENGTVKNLTEGSNNFMLQATGLYTVATSTF